MKKFSKMIIDDKEIEGEGYFSRNEEEIYVQAVDEIIRSTFREMQSKEVKINHLEFTVEESKAVYNGEFFVESVYGNQITLME